ncbi:hypothetical protein GCK72_016925 [Caenorhabditis remanei]|uniref:Uncharacterized protein n=1 Tax=Caenorhabditis remanei TaxID=31234 RepID=A0A6A5G678_CAERE|nr:hypothetical protein GCK72_016925 [Caenorhabditis remanei]KAF1750376.1 hypothetical protein GCK72_016925 [Caenorhabditis remanei]
MEDPIYNLPEYLNFRYSFNFATILAIIPFIYMTPTILVMWMIIRTYWGLKTPPMDRHIFACIVLNFICSLLFFLSDYLRISLPSTGLLTSWCATIAPNHYFKVIYLLSFFFNYCILILPFLLSLIRVVILFRPQDHVHIIPKLMMICLPLLLIIPLGCTAFMIPALGYCRTMKHPFKFGAVYIYYYGEWSGWRNSYIHLIMSVVMCILTLSCTGLMLYKLRATTADSNISSFTKKSSTRAERSLTITIIASMIPFINNTALTIIYLTLPEYVYYFIIIRPFGNDIETCILPWILYLTHPMFKKMGIPSSETSSVSVVNQQKVSSV